MVTVLQIPQNFRGIYLVQEDVIVKKEVLDSISKIDTLVFDIDGVLIDVKDSFRNAISQTVQFYFKEMLRFDGEEILIHPEEVAFFKMAGGFNNDWELTSAVILFYLWKAENASTKNIDIIKNENPDIKTFCTEILKSGGGLRQIVEWIEHQDTFKENIFKQWDGMLIIKLFKEIYAGKENCYNIYHFHPTIIQSDGLLSNEKNIFDASLKEKLKAFSLGILSGRYDEEARRALVNLKWNDLIPEKQVMTADKVAGKPNPEGLRELSKYFHTKLGLYIGDILDDLMTAKNYNRESRQNKFLSAIVLEKDFNKQTSLIIPYLEEGVDLLARDVNDVLRWVLKKQNREFFE